MMQFEVLQLKRSTAVEVGEGVWEQVSELLASVQDVCNFLPLRRKPYHVL